MTEEHIDPPSISIARLEEKVKNVDRNFTDAIARIEDWQRRWEVKDEIHHKERTLQIDALAGEMRVFSGTVGSLLAIQTQTNTNTKEIESLKIAQSDFEKILNSSRNKLVGGLVVLGVLLEATRWGIGILISYLHK